MTRPLFILAVFLGLIACNGSQKNDQGNRLVDMAADTIQVTKQAQDSVVILSGNLPVCIDYSESNFNDSIYSGYRDYSKADDNYLSDRTALSKDYVRQYWFSNNDTIYYQNREGDTVAKDHLSKHYFEQHDCYLIDTLFSTNNFVAILYEAIDDNSSEKYFCTYRKSGELITKITIAWYGFAGSYTNVDGGRTPFWKVVQGCIGKDLIVSIDGTQRFSIKATGRMAKIKW